MSYIEKYQFTRENMVAPSRWPPWIKQLHQGVQSAHGLTQLLCTQNNGYTTHLLSHNDVLTITCNEYLVKNADGTFSVLAEKDLQGE